MNKTYNKHYVIVNGRGCIIAGWSDGPNPDMDSSNAVCINEHGGYQFRLFPDGEENPCLFIGGKTPLYKLVDRQVVSRTQDELDTDQTTVEVIRNAKIAEISAACNTAIVEGIDIELGGETEHFNLSIEDQSNIANLFRVVELGGTEFPYQADGGKCRIYTAHEIAAIYIAAQAAITTQTTYHNELKAYVQSLDNVKKISAVTYGMDLPKKYKDEMDTKLAVANEQMNAIVERLGGQA